MVLLGEVDQVEVARERVRNLLRALERPRGHDLFCLLFVPVRVARADDRPPQALDVLEQTRAAVVLDHDPKLRAEHANVPAQGVGNGLSGEGLA